MLNFETSFHWRYPAATTFTFKDGFLERGSGEISKKCTRVLLPGDPEYKMELYDPLNEHMDLYRLFSLLEDDEKSIENFANEFGLLGVAHQSKVTGIDNLIWTETHPSWKDEIRRLRLTLDLWESIRPRGHPETLKSKLSWSRGKGMFMAVQYFSTLPGQPLEGSREVYHSKNTSIDSPIIQYGDNLLAAQQAVEHDIDQQLQKHTSARFLSIRSDLNPPASRLSLQPKNLLGAIWLQLALEVSGLTVYDPCLQCNRPMVEPIKRGKLRKTCSGACRKRLYRSKQ